MDLAYTSNDTQVHFSTQVQGWHLTDAVNAVALYSVFGRALPHFLISSGLWSQVITAYSISEQWCLTVVERQRKMVLKQFRSSPGWDGRVLQPTFVLVPANSTASSEQAAIKFTPNYANSPQVPRLTLLSLSPLYCLQQLLCKKFVTSHFIMAHLEIITAWKVLAFLNLDSTSIFIW